MAKASKYTKKYKKLYWIFFGIKWTLLLCPIMIYVIMALADNGVVASHKIAVVSTVIIATVLTVFNIMLKKNLTCILWIILLGLHVAFKNQLLPLIVILAISSILNDFILTPVCANLKTSIVASRVMDKRKL